MRSMSFYFLNHYWLQNILISTIYIRIIVILHFAKMASNTKKVNYGLRWCFRVSNQLYQKEWTILDGNLFFKNEMGMKLGNLKQKENFTQAKKKFKWNMILSSLVPKKSTRRIGKYFWFRSFSQKLTHL